MKNDPLLTIMGPEQLLPTSSSYNNKFYNFYKIYNEDILEASRHKKVITVLYSDMRSLCLLANNFADKNW
jgi:hypothetical protein